jgi:streptolysin S family bacteriocin protoxin
MYNLIGGAKNNNMIIMVIVLILLCCCCCCCSSSLAIGGYEYMQNQADSSGDGDTTKPSS